MPLHGCVSLGNQAVTFRRGSDLLGKGLAAFILDLWPKTKITYVADVWPTRLQTLDDYRDSTLTLDEGLELDHLTTFFQLKSSGDGFIELKGRLQSIQTSPRTMVHHVITHIAGFDGYVGTPTCDPHLPQPNWMLTRAELAHGEWRITLDELPPSPEKTTPKSARLSHVMEIRRSDEDLFALADTTELLNSLHSFLSFISGKWVAPLIATGLDRNGARVSEDWSLRRSSPLHSGFSWFDPRMTAAELEQAYKLWCAAMQHQTYRVGLESALPLSYTAKFSGLTMEPSLVLAQTALETLSWTILVEDTKQVSADDFEKKAADWRVRKLLKWAGIAPGVPRNLKALYACRSQRDFHDGPKAIANLRHWFLHPSASNANKVRAIPRDCFYEALRLASWYLELVPLKLIGWTGHYSNRLTRQRVGDVALVPWGSPPPYPPPAAPALP